MDFHEHPPGERLALHPGLTLVAAALLAGCAVPTPTPCIAPEPALVAWVANYGWHTEIIVPAAGLTGPLAPFRTPGTTALSFGFGKLDFFVLPNPGLTDFVGGTVPGPAAVRVVTLHVAPARSTSSPLTRLPLTAESLRALQAFLLAAIVRAPDGTPVIAAAPPDADTKFYAATHGYSLAYTCNAWVADGLDQSGLPMAFGIEFSGGVMASVARINGACSAN